MSYGKLKAAGAMTGDRTVALSVAIITHNEQAALPACLDSVSFASELVIVDSGSTDQTPEVAAEYGARFFVEDWKGFGAQKTSAIEKCTNEWVLLLDADERLSPGAQKEVRSLVENPPTGVAGFRMRRKNHIGGRPINHSGWWPDRLIRLVRKDRVSVRGDIHELVEVDGTVRDTSATILHYGYRDYAHMVQKMNTYSTLSAEDMLRRGKKSGAIAPLVHGTAMLLRTLVLRGGVLDGLDGITISVMNGVKTYLKYARLAEMLRGDRR